MISASVELLESKNRGVKIEDARKREFFPVGFRQSRGHLVRIRIGQSGSVLSARVELGLEDS